MKIGIVGTGNISSRHLDEFNNMPNVNVEAVCDTNQRNLEIFLSNNKNLDIRGYLSLEEMLEKINTHALTFFKLFRLRVTEVDWKRAEINTNFKKDLESRVNKTNAKINLYLGHLSDHFF